MKVVKRDNLSRPVCRCLDCGQLVIADQAVREFRIYFAQPSGKWVSGGWIQEHCPEGALKRVNRDGALVREEPSPLREMLDAPT